MSASGDDVEDSTEYSRYGIKDAPQTAIATPLGQVSARFLQNLQGVGLSRVHVIEMLSTCKNKGIIIFFIVCVYTHLFIIGTGYCGHVCPG